MYDLTEYGLSAEEVLIVFIIVMIFFMILTTKTYFNKISWTISIKFEMLTRA